MDLNSQPKQGKEVVFDYMTDCDSNAGYNMLSKKYTTAFLPFTYLASKRVL